jgi:CheY-like chemotaxis protein
MLALKGYEAAAVPSGQLALDILRQRKFDVLLIDCVMPEMDGYALASAVRATGSAARSSSSATVLGGPALLAMTPRHDPEEVKKCLEAGFDALLIKPFTMTSLDQKIREHVLQ